jgi:hypothetical protein
MEMAVKYEKITLWTATQTYGPDDRGLSALDYIRPALDELDAECQILDYDGEDYKLVKAEVAQAEAAVVGSVIAKANAKGGAR